MKEIKTMYNKYLQLKEQHKDCEIAIRIGDFYEVFGDDAKTLAEKLDLTLTARLINGVENRVYMIGFPYHIAKDYVNKAKSLGVNLLLCD